MPHRRDIRRLAMQVLYQVDLRGEADLPAVRESLTDGPDAPPVQHEAMDLAEAAWRQHDAADALASELAPAWPTHRQPPLDRALLRLAYHEMTSGFSPPKVAINEAVELAKQYCSQNSPAFVNGVLDKMARRLEAQGLISEPGTLSPHPGDPWLADAVRNVRENHEGTKPDQKDTKKN